MMIPCLYPFSGELYFIGGMLSRNEPAPKPWGVVNRRIKDKGVLESVLENFTTCNIPIAAGRDQG